MYPILLTYSATNHAPNPHPALNAHVIYRDVSCDRTVVGQRAPNRKCTQNVCVCATPALPTLTEELQAPYGNLADLLLESRWTACKGSRLLSVARTQSSFASFSGSISVLVLILVLIALCLFLRGCGGVFRDTLTYSLRILIRVAHQERCRLSVERIGRIGIQEKLREEHIKHVKQIEHWTPRLVDDVETYGPRHFIHIGMEHSVAKAN
mmetsp:Transcript_157/g.476  ORF Transcript_157/g.476 Transcript_157/m.476 type:complete len:209 (-) Transcript_157:293-919(-)